MSAFSWLAMPPPDAAVEIGPDAITLAMIGARGSQSIVQGYAIEPLAPGLVVPSLTTRNVADRGAVLTALRAAVERLGARPRRIALALPDLVARVSLVRFERVPAGRDDLDQLIRWQLKKSAPFPIEDARVSYTPATRRADEGEFLALLARRDAVREYESLCEDAGMQPGLVDLSTLGLIDLFLGAPSPPTGDWLLVHLRPEGTSLAILRGADVIFFRTRPEGEEESLADLVHQTTMYYQDRLGGRGFTRVLLGGTARGPAAVAEARRALEARLGVKVESVDPTAIVTLGERAAPRPELLSGLAPVLGLLLRGRILRLRAGQAEMVNA